MLDKCHKRRRGALHMNFLFCSNPLDLNDVDFDYKQEFDISKKEGNKCALFSYEDMIEGMYK